MTRRQITLCGVDLTGPRHICCFFDSREQQHAAFVPYLHEGLGGGEQVICILAQDRHPDLAERLERAGVDVARDLASNQLKILNDDDTYVRGGVFAKVRMKELLRQALEDARKSPFPYVRTLGEMDWALRNLPGTDDLMEYECSVNELLAEYDCTLACAYDVNKFSGRVLMDALNTHSHVVLQGVVHSNPYYLPPEEYRRQQALRPTGPGPIASQASAKTGVAA